MSDSARHSKGSQNPTTLLSEDTPPQGDPRRHDKQEEYEVDHIEGWLMDRQYGKKYVVRWKGYPRSENTCEPLYAIRHLDAFRDAKEKWEKDPYEGQMFVIEKIVKHKRTKKASGDLIYYVKWRGSHGMRSSKTWVDASLLEGLPVFEKYKESLSLS